MWADNNYTSLIASFMGPTWGPSGGRKAPGGPHVGPMNFAIWEFLSYGRRQYYTYCKVLPLIYWMWNSFSYTLSREYRVVRSIFAAVIHQWRSPLRQFARARTIDEYDVTMPVAYIRVTSQINCGDVTILSQKILSLATMANSAIDNWISRIVCSWHQIACKK